MGYYYLEDDKTAAEEDWGRVRNASTPVTSVYFFSVQKEVI